MSLCGSVAAVHLNFQSKMLNMGSVLAFRSGESMGNSFLCGIWKMGRRPDDPEHSRFVFIVLLLVSLFSCVLVYVVVSTLLNPNISSQYSKFEVVESIVSVDLERREGDCCRGIENLELWGQAVKWGTDFKFNSSVDCCQTCKTMCNGNDGPCLCDSGDIFVQDHLSAY